MAADAGTAPLQDPTAKPNLVGVHGWLKWLCIVMTIITPVFVGASIVNELSLLSRVPESAWLFVGICDALGAIAAGFVIFAGVRLWRVRPGAPFLAQVALGTMTLTTFGTELAGSLYFEHYQWDTTSTVRSLVGALIWITYLNQSVRVKNTFKDAPVTTNNYVAVGEPFGPTKVTPHVDTES